MIIKPSKDIEKAYKKIESELKNNLDIVLYIMIIS